MTNRYDQRFAQLKAAKKRAFIPFTLLGWPNRDRSLSIIKTMIDSGASALELGLAFSDPIADGPTIQRAAFETLSSGFKVSDAFDLVRNIRTLDSEIPIGLLVYYNMILAHGARPFFEQARDAGADGILVADLPPEAAEELAPAAQEYSLTLIFIVSPLTSAERLDLILKHAGGFLYAVSRLGITGVEERYDTQLKNLIDKVHARTQLPVCVGFGISTPDQARAMLALGADGVITGSRIIALVNSTGPENDLQQLRDFLLSLLQTVESPELHLNV